MLKILYPLILFSPLLFALNIQESIDIALQNNPDIQKQKLNKQLSKVSFEATSAKDYGKFSALASYNHYNLPRTLVPLTPASILSDPIGVATTKDLINVGVVYDVALFTGFAQKNSLEISSLQKEMSQAKLHLSREQLIYNVKSIFTNILNLQAKEKAQETYIEALQSLHVNIKHEVTLGRKSKLEALKSASALALAQQQADALHSNITILRASLAALMNVEELGALEDADEKLQISSIKELNQDKLERFKLNAIALKKSQKAVKKSEASYYPQVGFSAYYAQNFGPNDNTNKNSGDWHNEEIWQLGVNAKWNIFDFGVRSASSQKAKIQELSAKLDKTKTQLEFKKMLIEAQSKLQNTLQNHKSVSLQLDLALESEQIEQIRYDNGANDINDLLLAKAKSQLAKSQLIGVDYQYKIDNYYLDYLLEQGDKK